MITGSKLDKLINHGDKTKVNLSSFQAQTTPFFGKLFLNKHIK